MKTFYLSAILSLVVLAASAQTCTPTVSIAIADSSDLNVYCDPLVSSMIYIYQTTNEGTSPYYRWYYNDSLCADSVGVFRYVGFVGENDTIYAEMTSSDPCANGTTVRSNIFILHGHSPRVLSGVTSQRPACQSTQITYYITSVNADTMQLVADHYYGKRLSPAGTWSNPRVDTIVANSMPGDILHPYVRAWNYSYTCFSLFGIDTALYVLEISPPVQHLCMVSIDSDSHSPQVIWEKANKNATDSFFIYRAQTPDSAYSLVAAMDKDSLSAWTDMNALSDNFSYRYKISLLDTCGNYSVLSPFIQTLYLIPTGNGNFSWIPYIIEGDTSGLIYQLYRDSAGLGQWQLIQTIPTGQTTASDPQFVAYHTASYRLEAQLPYSCHATRSGSYIESNILEHPYLSSAISDVPAADGLSVSPDPFSDRLKVHFSEGDIALICIYDMAGRLVYSLENPQSKISINSTDWESGIYLLRVSGSHTARTTKIVKE